MGSYCDFKCLLQYWSLKLFLVVIAIKNLEIATVLVNGMNMLARGIPEYWIVDPIEEIVLVLDLQNGEYSSRSFTGEMTMKRSSFPALNITAKQVLSARL